MKLVELREKIENCPNYEVEKEYEKFFYVNLRKLEEKIKGIYPELKIEFEDWFDEKIPASVYDFYLVSADGKFRANIMQEKCGYEDDIFLGCCSSHESKLKYFSLFLLGDNGLHIKRCESTPIHSEYPKLNNLLWSIVKDNITTAQNNRVEKLKDKIAYYNSHPEPKCFEDSVYLACLEKAMPEIKKKYKRLTEDFIEEDLSMIKDCNL